MSNIIQSKNTIKNKASQVLIVDDMPINRMILSSLLAANCIYSDQAESGAKCLELCNTKDYDLILLDHRMPDLDGVDTLVKLKELFESRKKQIPVICHTTEEGRKNINLYKAAGFADVLIKPIDPAELSGILMTYLPETDEAHVTPEVKDLTALNKEEPATSNEYPDEIDEILKLPLWLKSIPHINLVDGIANCETAEDYIEALFVFYSSIEEKSDIILDCLVKKDFNRLRLCVHSLKSMSRLIGARSLSRQAASLETAAENESYQAIKQDVPELIELYRKLKHLLAPIENEHISDPTKESQKEISLGAFAGDPTRTVLFVHTNTNIISRGTETILSEAGFKVVSIPDEPDMIINHRFDADIVLYYPGASNNSHIGLTMNFLGEICQDDTKLLCVTGDSLELNTALSAKWAHRITKTYPRPVDNQVLISDFEHYSKILKEYKRKKTIFLVDDDKDYLDLLSGWLNTSFNVSAFNRGADLLEGLNAAIPDMMIFDYEMPEMDGYDLLKMIRENEKTKKIPVIFLTGKNDRDHVFRILDNKPDGYLLKTSSKDALIDRIKRFFSEMLFRSSRNCSQANSSESSADGI